MPLIPNEGQHTAWNPQLSPLPRDTAKASAYICNTAWLRILNQDGGNVVLSTTNAMLTHRVGTHFAALSAAEEQFQRMLAANDADWDMVTEIAQLAENCKSASDSFEERLFGDAAPASRTDEDLRAVADLHAAATLAGVASWLTVSRGQTARTEFMRRVEESAGTTHVRHLAACEILSLVSETTCADAEWPCLAAALSPIAFRGRTPSQMSRADLLVGLGVVLGATYFAPFRQLYSAAFAPAWSLAVVNRCAPSPSAGDHLVPYVRRIVSTMVEATVAVAQFAALQVKVKSQIHLSLPPTIALMVCGLTDAGKTLGNESAETLITQQQQQGCKVDFASREAFVAMTSRALMETFTTDAFVSGPLQWLTKPCGGIIDGHPLTHGVSNSAASQSVKRLRSETRSVRAVHCNSNVSNPIATWDITTRDFFPLLLSQTVFEWPWPSFEAVFRNASGGHHAAHAGSSSTVAIPPKLRLERRAADALTNDVFAVIAKEVALTTYPSRLAGLCDARGSLRTACDEIEAYEARGSTSAEAHRQLVRPNEAPVAVRGRDAPKPKLQPMTAPAHLSLSAAPTYYPTPPTLDGPIGVAMYGLMQLSASPPAADDQQQRWSATDLLKAVMDRTDLLPAIIELKAGGRGHSAALINTVRHRVAVDVILMGLLRLSQLRHRDQTEHWLFHKSANVLSVLRVAAANANTGVSGTLIAAAVAALHQPLPHAVFDFTAYLAEGSEAAGQWAAGALGHSHGYSPLSVLMQSVFGTTTSAPNSRGLHHSSLTGPTALTLEAFAQLLLLRIIATELDVTHPDNGVGAAAPMSSPSTDIAAWCLLYGKQVGLSTMPNAEGNGTAERTFYGRFSHAALKNNNSGAVSASPFFNPLTVDHPTRGAAVRRVLWDASEILSTAVLRAAAAPAGMNTTVNNVRLEAHKFVEMLRAFGLLEWSLFGQTWSHRFGELLR